jgi:membrane protease YdiL (CAAX protease family)|tara:strand:- start:68 stop:529 length:462 start_codon:yes stop_codon:yes gene_type:complete
MRDWAVKNPYKAAILGGALISLFPAWFVTQAVRMFPSLKPEELQIVSDFFSSGIGPFQIMLFAIVVFIIPPVEELIFRSTMWRFFEWITQSPKWTWICISVLFAVFHMEPLHIVGLLPLSFFLGWLRLKTGDIGASTVAHMANNAVGCLIMVI